MTIRRRKVDAWEWTCKCERCGHEWSSVSTGVDEAGRPAPPKHCAGCKAINWNKPARAYRRKEP